MDPKLRIWKSYKTPFRRAGHIFAKFMAKFILNKLYFKNFLDSRLTYALNFAVCYRIFWTSYE